MILYALNIMQFSQLSFREQENYYRLDLYIILF